MPFVKGQSGNPGGRPKFGSGVADRTKTMMSKKDEIDPETQEKITRLDYMLQQLYLDTKSSDRQTRIAARAELLNRGWGRPVQPVEASVESQIEVSISMPVYEDKEQLESPVIVKRLTDKSDT